MYDVTLNGKTIDTTSFDAAKNAVKAEAVEYAAKLAQPVRNGLYRSPKATARVNADRARSAAKLLNGIKLPKKVENVSGNVGGFSFAITRR